jgi:hypothetical protein
MKFLVVDDSLTMRRLKDILMRPAEALLYDSEASFRLVDDAIRDIGAESEREPNVAASCTSCIARMSPRTSSSTSSRGC